MKRGWLGVALLAASWLLGLSYYHQANWACWALLVVVAAPLFGTVAERIPSRCDAVISLVLVLPAIWLAPWPYRAGPILLAVGLAVVVASGTRRKIGSVGFGAVIAGSIIVLQAAALSFYEELTARSHELPAALTNLLYGVSRMLGIESTIDDNHIVLHTMRRMHRLAATWELFCDPVTLCFVIGGLGLLAFRAGWQNQPGRFKAWSLAAGKLVLATLAWLPLRSGILMAIYLHRALRVDFDSPLALEGQFWNPWVQLLLLTPLVFFGWRFLRLPGNLVAPSEAAVNHATPKTPAWRRAVAIVAAAAAVALVVGLQWEPPGVPRAGRVAVDEFHSEWERTDRPMDTEWYGQMSAYNYYCVYDWLSRYFTMSRITKPIDDKTLEPIDVLIVKTPTVRYQPEEVAAIQRFVKRGGGLMLIGEHTDVFHTGEYLNQLASRFDFTFRYDVLFGVDSPFEEVYTPPLVPHPIVQHMPPLDFEISCSVEPHGPGQAVMQTTGLWNLPPDYHALNYYPQVEDRADTRFGAWIQAWATRHAAGRVVAFTDSTQFSNFSTFEPGKPEEMLGMIDWLNRNDTVAVVRTHWLFVIGAAVLAVLGLAMLVRWPDGLLVLLAAGLLGWFAAVVAIRAAHAAEYPLFKPVRSMTMIVMDRTTSDAPLPKGGFIAGKEDGFGIFERNIMRLGYFLSRKSGPAALDGNLLVVLHPDLDVTPEFRQQVEDWVYKQGGRLLVLDSPQNVKSTANSLLFPFGMSVDHATNFSGVVSLTSGGPSIPVASACTIIGGEPLALMENAPKGADGKPPAFAATKHFGDGTVTVVGFASRFTDINMGVTGELLPDADMRKVFEVEYRLLRGAVGEKNPDTPPEKPADKPPEKPSGAPLAQK